MAAADTAAVLLLAPALSSCCNSRLLIGLQLHLVLDRITAKTLSRGRRCGGKQNQLMPEILVHSVHIVGMPTQSE
jgi:hypothetical protein